ncbi:hypothetical protein MKW98_031141 [Papaver atlanticum]|uniref:Uncharacterized protein n=1 Tax=Papaver atlanticum TaxID=357466 RepID=A0AAD4SV03_9MAGN|nr:hypothetical protein MKW98_031141 [Papaver atlanticum]
MYVGESVDEEWKSNSAEIFELIGSVLKEVTLLEKELDQKMEETSIDLTSVKDFIHNSSTPTTVEEGNFRSTPKIDFTDISGAGSTNSVKDYKVRSKFLDYQEGKPFFSEYNSRNAVLDFQIRKVRNIEVDKLNHAFKDKFQQFEGWKFIEEDNLNQFPSYFTNFIRLYIVTHPSQIAYICDVLSNDEHTRLIFDQGREFDEFFFMNKYTNDFVYKLILKLGYGVELLFVDSNAFLVVKDGDSCNGRKLFVKMLQRGGITIYKYGRRLFDPGKDLDLLRSGNSVCKLTLEPWYYFDLLFEHSNVFLFVKSGDCRDASKLFNERQQQGSILWTVLNCLILHTIIAHEMLNQRLGADISFLTQMGQVQKGFVAATPNSSHKQPNCTSMTVGGLFHMCATSGKCFCDCLVLARTLFDRGKLFELPREKVTVVMFPGYVTKCCSMLLFSGRW